MTIAEHLQTKEIYPRIMQEDWSLQEKYHQVCLCFGSEEGEPTIPNPLLALGSFQKTSEFLGKSSNTRCHMPIFPSSAYNSSHAGPGPTLIVYDLIWTWLHQQRPCFIITKD